MDHVLYVQDNIKKGNLAINLGLRFQNTTGTLPAQSSPAGPFSPRPILPRAGGINWNDLAPRVGLVWDLGGNHKALLKTGYGRYYHQLSPDPIEAPSQNALGGTGLQLERPQWRPAVPAGRADRRPLHLRRLLDHDRGCRPAAPAHRRGHRGLRVPAPAQHRPLNVDGDLPLGQQAPRHHRGRHPLRHRLHASHRPRSRPRREHGHGRRPDASRSSTSSRSSPARTSASSPTPPTSTPASRASRSRCSGASPTAGRGCSATRSRRTT